MAPANRQTLAREVADTLLDAISKGELRPGARLNEVEIAEQMETSRGPVREAFRYLQEAGVIETIPHRGTYVVHPTLDDLAEMITMRAFLEGLAGRLMVGAGAGGLKPLDDVLLAMRAAAEKGDIDQVREHDWQFHETICVSSGLEQLHRTWLQLRSRIGLMMLLNRPSSDLMAVVDDHESLVDALRTATPSEAETIIRARALDRGFSWLGRTVPEALRD